MFSVYRRQSYMTITYAASFCYLVVQHNVWCLTVPLPQCKSTKKACLTEDNALCMWLRCLCQHLSTRDPE